MKKLKDKALPLSNRQCRRRNGRQTKLADSRSRLADCVTVGNRGGLSTAEIIGRHEHTIASQGVVEIAEFEKLMTAVWVDILDLKEIRSTEDFFVYGRDSFLAMKIIQRVRRVFGVNISVKALFENPTVSGMAAAVLKCQHYYQNAR